jgi:DNA-binding transcriptional MocR family regulator
VDIAELRPKLRSYDADLRQGTLFSSQNALRDWMRLGFCSYAPEEITAGVRRISECLRLSGII